MTKDANLPPLLYSSGHSDLSTIKLRMGFLMKGQWIGSYSGTVPGSAMVNIDEVEGHYEGTAYLIPGPTGMLLPASIAHFETVGQSEEEPAKAVIFPVDPRNRLQTTWDSVKTLFAPEVNHSTSASVSFRLREGRLELKATTDIGVVFEAILERPAIGGESKIAGKKKTWDEFKAYASSLSKSEKLIFRGQKKPWRLCTNFHRNGRYRVNEFARRDVPMLYRRLSSITSHFFQPSDADQNGAFFNLLQHHGYPTPLLDWSLSPYVAAFFAFRDRASEYKEDEFVRIFIFNYREWEKYYPPIQHLDPVCPHVSVMEFLAIENRRMVPQQAVTTVTNLDDLESYILKCGQERNIEFLEAIDIPAKQRGTAMQDLRFMGITAGSMFPGIDGVCEEFREINFG